MEKKLTTKQLEALFAALAGRSSYTGGGGGAIYRMIDRLHDDGYLQRSAQRIIADALGVKLWELRDGTLPPDLRRDNGGLSVKGLEYLDKHLRSGRRYDPTDGRLALIRDQLVTRRGLDIARDAYVALAQNTAKAARDRKAKALDLALLSGVRTALTSYGIDGDAMTDQTVRDLVKDLTSAQHGYGYVRFMDDHDLSAELDATEKTAVTPGAIGDVMRSEKLAAIRAEFKRRAEAGNDADYNDPR